MWKTQNFSRQELEDLQIDMIVWSQKQLCAKQRTLGDLLNSLYNALERNRRFCIFFSSLQVEQFLVILKQYGYIHDFYKYQGFEVQSSRVRTAAINTFFVIYMKPWELLGNQRKFFRVFSQKVKFCFLSYKQVKYLTNNSKRIFVFQIKEGLVTQQVLLKQKIGGTLLGSFS